MPNLRLVKVHSRGPPTDPLRLHKVGQRTTLIKDQGKSFHVIGIGMMATDQRANGHGKFTAIFTRKYAVLSIFLLQHLYCAVAADGMLLPDRIILLARYKGSQGRRYS